MFRKTFLLNMFPAGTLVLYFLVYFFYVWPVVPGSVVVFTSVVVSKVLLDIEDVEGEVLVF